MQCIHVCQCLCLRLAEGIPFRVISQHTPTATVRDKSLLMMCEGFSAVAFCSYDLSLPVSRCITECEQDP